MDEWDFSKLPESEHQAVIDAVGKKDFRTLISIHDRYGLSRFSYCCNAEGLLSWYQYGIETNFSNGARQTENQGLD